MSLSLNSLDPMRASFAAALGAHVQMDCATTSVHCLAVLSCLCGLGCVLGMGRRVCAALCVDGLVPSGW